MEENSVNIGEILKDAPRGLKLYSPIFGEVELNCVYDTVGERNTIETFDNRRYLRLFSSNGKFHNCPDGECMLFPSEKHRSWVEWQNVLFKRGDVISDGEETYIFRSKGNVNLRITNKEGLNILLFKTLSCRYATSEEKEHFFKELENNGYRWDDTIKEIVEIKCSNPEYNTKIDNLLKNNTFHYPEQETEVEVTPDGCYKCVLKPTKNELINTDAQENPFIINDLKPFDKVLVRNDKKNKWVVEFFSYYNSLDGVYICGGGSWWNYCMPFNNETSKLIGTTNEYSTNNKSK